MRCWRLILIKFLFFSQFFIVKLMFNRYRFMYHRRSIVDIRLGPKLASDRDLKNISVFILTRLEQKKTKTM